MEVYGAESFAGWRSTLLPDLSAECISIIVSLLPFVDVTSLLLSGSSTLSSRIIRQVREIDVLLGAGNKLPLNAYNFPHLHSLSIKANLITFEDPKEIVVYEPYLVDNDILVKPHNTLSKLVLHGYLAFTILLPSNTHGPLEELLPNLLSLNLASPDHFKDHHTNNIPSTLTELFLSACPSDRLPISTANKLPRTLTTLTLHNIPFKLGNDSLESISFPPALTSYITSSPLPLTIIAYLPRSLQTLEFGNGSIEGTTVLKVSDLPPSLTSLVIPDEDKYITHYLALDIPLTSFGLKTLILPKQRFHLITDANNLESSLTTLNGVLPPTLTSFAGISKLFLDIDWCNTTPLLEDCDIMFSTEIPFNLPPLRSLILSQQLNTRYIATTMPATLTKLTAHVFYTPEWLDAISKLTRLQDLILCSSNVLPSDGFWNMMKTRLTSLACSVESFESLQDLQGWERLESLHLPSYGGDAPKILESAEDGHQATLSLPTTVTNLRISFALPLFTYLSFSNLTRLETLKLSFTLSDSEETILPCSLPPSLKSFSVFTFRPVALSLYAALPNNLKSLEIEYFGEQAIGEEHFQAMPKSLVAIRAPYQKLNTPKGWSIGSHLPNLVYGFGNINSRASIEMQRQKHVASAPSLTWATM